MGKITTKMLLGLCCFIGATPVLHAHGEGVVTLQQKDPSGIVLTLTAVSVVFIALVLLVLVFQFIGRYLHRLEKAGEESCANGGVGSKQQSSSAVTPEMVSAIALAIEQEQGRVPSEPVVAAIALALDKHLSEQHDFVESYKLTIQHRSTLWNYRGQSLRQYP